MSKNRGFTLVELMVVVAIIAIISAVALPMYSNFRQKSRVGTVIKSIAGTIPALQDWFGDQGDFTEIALNPDNTFFGNKGAMLVRVGTGLPVIQNCTYSVSTAGAGNRYTFVIHFEFAGFKCPPNKCSGDYCLTCDSELNKCDIEIDVGDHTLGFSKQAGIGDCSI